MEAASGAGLEQPTVANGVAEGEGWRPKLVREEVSFLRRSVILPAVQAIQRLVRVRLPNGQVSSARARGLKVLTSRSWVLFFQLGRDLLIAPR